MKVNKLGATYSLFSGEELLKSSIISIRKHVDYINVVWQDVSWTGKPASSNVLSILNEYQEAGLIDKIIKFEFELDDTLRGNAKLTCQKKNLGLRDLKKAGCTHVLFMDVDEFYVEDEFAKAKEYVYKHGITHSVCSIYDYRIKPIYRMRDAQTYAVPFIMKMPLFATLRGKNQLPCRVDNLRVLPYNKLFNKFYYLNEVNMHHMTGLRKDYSLKMDSTISNYFEEGRKSIEAHSKLQSTMENMTEEEILRSGYIKVDDIFGLREEWE